MNVRVGKCIYCGSTEALSDEHIIPAGLGGRDMLLKGSCQRHRALTSACEGRIMRGHWHAMRIHRALIKRHRNADRNIYATRIIGGYKKKIRIVPREFPFVLFPEFDAPTGTLSGDEMATEPSAKNILCYNNPLYRRPDTAIALPPIIKVKDEFMVNFSVSDFISFASKIAYCYAISKTTLSDCRYVVSAIEGNVIGANRWFGNSPVCRTEFNGGGDICRLQCDVVDGVTVVDISFWSILDKCVPVYRIIMDYPAQRVGALRPHSEAE